jgi:recombination protein RecT
MGQPKDEKTPVNPAEIPSPETSGSTELAKRTPTASERFAANIHRQFAAEAGNTPEFTEYERTLAQHLFLKVDATLREMEEKRISKKQTDKAPFKWDNVNMRKLALDAVHRVKLGLDALIPAHIYPIPYWNSKEQKYDIDLRVGYVGKDYYRRMNCRDKPISIRYELVYSTDTFKPVKKSVHSAVESYEFEINNPFDRGDVVGGFGYIDFGMDNDKNILVLVSRKYFDKIKSSAQSQEFWGKYPEEMMYKTLVHRTTEKLALDPRCVNAASYAFIEQQDGDAEEIAARAIVEYANKEIIDADIIDQESLPTTKSADIPPDADSPPATEYGSGTPPF